MIDYRRSLRPVVVALGVTVAGFAGSGGIAQSASGPHIAVMPRSVMVNNTVNLRGSGWPANSPVRLQECGATAWVVPEDPCDTSNEITVMTGPSGRFTTPFEAQLCPRELPPKPPVTRETCYIGEPHSTGEDTAGLLGAAKIIVTYP